MDFYHYSVCHVCKQHSPNLKRCSKCKTLYYCSVEHQRVDWPSHKQLCKIINLCAELLLPLASNLSSLEYNRFKLTQSQLWKALLGRDLYSFEDDMWMDPKVCAVCYSQEAPIVCGLCLSVAYCSETHRRQHKHLHEAFCQQLKMCLENEQNSFIGKAILCYMFFTICISHETKCLPENIEEVVYSLNVENRAYYSVRPTELQVMTDALSYVVSIVYTLEKSGFIKNRRGRKKELVIHAVGSKIRCQSDVLKFSGMFLFNWITNLQSVKIFWVRPSHIKYKSFAFHNCSQCTSQCLWISVLHGPYNKLVAELPRPDLVTRFNISSPSDFCGNSCLDAQNDMYSLTFYKKVPALLTSFTKRDLDQSMQCLPPQVRRLVEPQLNNYRSKRPTRYFDVGMKPVVYNNHFIAVIVKD